MSLNPNMRKRKWITQQHLKRISEASNDTYVKAAVEEYLEGEMWFYAGIPKSDTDDLKRAIEYNVKESSEGIRFENSEIVKFATGEISYDGTAVNYTREPNVDHEECININLKISKGTDSNRVKELMRSPDVIAFLNEVTRP